MPSGLIDVHAHLLPDFYVEQATAAGHAHPDGMGGWPSWSVEAHLDLMDRNGIETAMLSMSSPACTSATTRRPDSSPGASTSTPPN